MSDIAIRAEGLGKLYRLGARERYQTLRDTLTDTLAAPFRRWGRRRDESGGPDTIWALKDVSFEVKHGEVIGIIGRNGAGKSTLLKILSRITEPTCGEAHIHGRIASLLEVGTGFHPELSGRDNIYLNGAILGMKKAEIRRKFDEIVAFAEVEKFIDTPVKHYSSGMYVRLAFAVAAHLEPEILIVDEVLAVGDAEFQKKCLGKMKNVSRSEGRTVFFVSHNMAAVQSLCSSAVVLDQGRVTGIGDVNAQIGAYLGMVAAGNRNEAHEGRKLTSTLSLDHLSISPNPLRSGQACDLNLQLSSSSSGQVRELALLIYSAFGARVAIIDLRKISYGNRIGPQTKVNLTCNIASMPLVEGDYTLGLYVNCGETIGDFYELATLTVVTGRAGTEFAPYSPHDRGVLELTY